jgi:transposase
MAKRRDQAKERYWRKHLAAWRRSGRSVRAYCADEGLAEASFYAWKRILIQRDRRGDTVAVAETPAEVSPFVPVRLIEDTTSAALEVVLRGGRVLRVGAGFAPQTLRDVVRTLEELPC